MPLTHACVAGVTDRDAQTWHSLPSAPGYARMWHGHAARGALRAHAHACNDERGRVHAGRGAALTACLTPFSMCVSSCAATRCLSASTLNLFVPPRRPSPCPRRRSIEAACFAVWRSGWQRAQAGGVCDGRQRAHGGVCVVAARHSNAVPCGRFHGVPSVCHPFPPTVVTNRPWSAAKATRNSLSSTQGKMTTGRLCSCHLATQSGGRASAEALLDRTFTSKSHAP